MVLGFSIAGKPGSQYWPGLNHSHARLFCEILPTAGLSGTQEKQERHDRYRSG